MIKTNRLTMLRLASAFFLLCMVKITAAQKPAAVKTVNADSGWASNSVNTVVFRKNSLVTHKGTQYIAFYNKNKWLVLGKRKIGSAKWQFSQTQYKGNAADAHNSISIMTDADGYLHVAWDHHGNPLNYCKSKSPGSLTLTEKTAMTGLNEEKLTYPEFHRLSDGSLLFLYRDGQSGKGNLVINRYDIKTKQWAQLHKNLIDGEGKRNAYWQACTDTKGTIHLSWVWRESADVASNHDMCYARSTDGGISWQTSEGEKYTLPITATTAEYACIIPQKSELINQTAMYADEEGHPYIATYWRQQNDSVPQYRLLYKNEKEWKTQSLGYRKTAFSLSGAGTKRIPVARPQIIAWKKNGQLIIAMILRDAERNNKVTIALCTDIASGKWLLQDITTENLGSWEPTYDTELWKQKKWLHLFIQKSEQADAEGKADLPAQMISVLEWKPMK